MIVDIKAVVGYFRKGGDLSRARAVEEAYYIYADNMAKAKPETVCELEMPEVKPSLERRVLEPDWLAREVSDLRREVDALKAERSEVGSTSHCDDCGGRIKENGTCYCEGQQWARVDPQWVVVAGGTPGIVSSLRYNLPAEKATPPVKRLSPANRRAILELEKANERARRATSNGALAGSRDWAVGDNCYLGVSCTIDDIKYPVGCCPRATVSCDIDRETKFNVPTIDLIKKDDEP